MREKERKKCSAELLRRQSPQDGRIRYVPPQIEMHSADACHILAGTAEFGGTHVDATTDFFSGTHLGTFANFFGGTHASAGGSDAFGGTHMNSNTAGEYGGTHVDIAFTDVWE
jgi:hypothetical protein